MDERVPLSELELLAGGREAEIFTWNAGLVLRLGRDPARAIAIEREATALAAAGGAGAPVPAVHELLTVEGRRGAVMERIDGETLLERLGRRPWTVLAVGRALGVLHARLHAVAAPPELPSLHDDIGARLESALVPAEIRDRTLATLATLPEGDRLHHGDFHPGNVLTGPRGLVVIDWTNGARSHPAADVARTCLLLATAGLPPDAPPRVILLDRAGRRLLLGRYVSEYREHAALDLDLAERWLAVCAAARLADDIESERPALLAIAAGDAEAGIGLPGARPLPPDNRRWLVQNALAITAAINLVLNAAIAWLSARGVDEIPLWSATVGETNLIADTVGTFFLLPLITCLLVTTAVRRDLERGSLRRLRFGDDRAAFLAGLPRGKLARGIALGALVTAVLAPPAVAILLLLDPAPLTVSAFVVYKAVVSVVLGAVVTPLIALRAMTDPA